MIFLLSILLAFHSTVFARQESLEELDVLLLSKNRSKKHKKKYVKPLLSRIKNIESKENIDIIFTLPPLIREKLEEDGFKGTFKPYNPSIIKTTEGYDVICRTSNYSPPDYKTLVPNDIHANKNFFLRYDKNFKLLYEQEIAPIPSHLAKKINKHLQIEDCRIFHWNGGCWLVGASSIGQKHYLPKIAIAQLTCFDNKEPVSIESFTLFYGPDQKRAEKNWMPLVDNQKLKFIYSYEPFMVLEVNIETGTSEQVLSYSSPLDFSRFRGSAAPISFENGYLMMVHERLRKFDYIHRFLFLDKNFNVTKLSLPFKFTGTDIEYCTSMTIDHSGNNLVIPIGVYDKEAKILIVDLDYVKGLLQDIQI